jgi:hypothetical protein
MTRKCILALLALLSTAASAHAQTIVDNGVDDRIEALNAVFAFRSDLSSTGTVIARCRIPTAHPDTGDVQGLDVRFQSLLARADSVQAGNRRGCGVQGFADPKHHVLWLEELVEINKTSIVGMLPAYRSKQFELTFQLLEGPGYREFHTYIVEPSGLTMKDGKTMIASWRVIEYRLAGWDFHWGDDLGHGSGVRLP